MYRSFFLSILIGTAALFAQDDEPYEHKTPAQIQAELDRSEALFKRALEMFNPWYTGPLVTPGAGLMPVGYGNITPQLAVTEVYAAYDKTRRSIEAKHRLISFNPNMGLAFGITPTMDGNIGIQSYDNWQNGRHGSAIGDSSAALGWPILRQGLWLPSIKFTIQETFPTGNYKHLHPDGLNGTGSGSWKTRLGLAAGKLLFWSYKHPFNLRAFLGYTMALPVKVKEFNSYGGGYGTRGTVHPGNTFSADIGMELSLTQNWVIANDIVYSATSESTFCGKLGTTTKHGTTPASVGTPYSDNLSLAPAIEYNWGDTLGIVAGVQFSVYGRSSANFLTGSFSVTWTFGPM